MSIFRYVHIFYDNQINQTDHVSLINFYSIYFPDDHQYHHLFIVCFSEVWLYGVEGIGWKFGRLYGVVAHFWKLVLFVLMGFDPWKAVCSLQAKVPSSSAMVLLYCFTNLV